MADFLLDHDVHPELGRRLGVLGHRAVRAYDRGLAGAEDAEILLHAARLSSILITCNKSHFSALHYAWLLWPAAWQTPAPPRHAGILGLDLVRRRDAEWWAAAVDQLLVSRQAPLSNELHLWVNGRWVLQP